MKKKTALGISLVCMLSLLCGCGAKDVAQNKTSGVPKGAETGPSQAPPEDAGGNMDGEVPQKVYQYEKPDFTQARALTGLNDFTGLTGLYGTDVVFYRFTKDGECVYYAYDTQEDTTTELGALYKFYMSTNANVCTDQKIYFYASTFGEKELTYNNLHCIDLNGHTLVRVSEEDLDTPLVYLAGNDSAVYAIKDYYSFTAHDRVQRVDAYKMAENETVTILQDKDVFFLHIDVSKDKLWALAVRNANTDSAQYVIQVYDAENGGLLEEYPCNELEDHIGYEAIYQFRIMGSYIYIQNFSRSSVIARLQNGELKIQNFFTDIEAPLNLVPNSDLTSDRGLLYRYGTNLLYYIDGDRLETFELPSQGDFNIIKYAYGSGDAMVAALQDKNGETQLYYYKYF